MEAGNRQDYSGLSSIPRESRKVAKYYDEWAAEYDESLADWKYDAPAQVASILQAELPPESVILDAGCGTGLSGRALSLAGFRSIDGIDVSARSLKVATISTAYRSLRELDMQRFPFPIQDDYYDGLTCVGVFTYLTDSAGTLKEFSRIVRSGGLLIMTQRSDLFIERNFEDTLNELSDAGVINRIRISEPRPYLPANDEFSDKILVHYIACTVA